MDSSQLRKAIRLSNFVDLSKVEIGVFWNMAECPIPENMDIGTVLGNIKKSLSGEGFNGRVTVFAYDNIYHDEEGYLKARVIADVLRGDADAHFMMILADILCWAVMHRAPANILVIMKDIEGRAEFSRAFELVSRKRYNFMLAQQVDSKVLHHHHVDKAWFWDTLSSGGPALPDDTATSSSHSHSVSALQEQVSANQI